MKPSLPAVLSATLAAAAVLAPAGSAAANPIDAAVATLRHNPVYVGAKSPSIEQSRLGGTTLRGIKIAIVPPGGPDPVAVAESIGQRLDRNDAPLTVVVFEDSSYGVASTAYCGTGKILDTVVAQHRRQLRTSDDVTATVADFAGRLGQAPRDNNGCSGSSGGTTSFGDTATSGGGISTGLIIVIVIIAAALIGLAALLGMRSRRKRETLRRTLTDARSQVEPYLERLAHDVQTIDPDGNRTAQQAMTDASERLRSAGRQLAAAQTEAQLAQAGRTVLEGLHATRTARTALGLPPGPELPPVATSQAPQLDRPQQVTVQGQTFQGYPSYAPGAPYYYPGGYGVPGGWYGFPFWETLLVGGMLGGFGGWGWGWGWGGYDAGFDTGYLTGYNAGEIAADQSAPDAGAEYAGADWGDSGGGGDWGGNGGSGDWGGGDPGGGDWGGGDPGGGGGDWGSGGDGGGNW